MAYALTLLIVGLAAFALLRHLLTSSRDRRPAVGALSDRWLLSQRGDEQ